MKKVKKFKKLAVMLISVLTVSSIMFTMNTSVLAATLPDLASNATKVVSIPTTKYNGVKCSNIGGLSVVSSGSNRRMFVVKSNKYEIESVLYFFVDYNNTASNFGKFELRGIVGHANAMAIDDNYIYITCWKYTDKESPANNDIVRISRSKLWSMYNAKTGIEKGTLTANSDGVTIFNAVTSSGANFNKPITAITKYKENGKFIINNDSLDSDDIEFTTASITNGQFVVSESAADIFTVNTGLTDTTAQDIGYDPQCGLFIARWLWKDGKSDSLKLQNRIIWIKLNSLSGNNRVYTKDNSKFRYIIVNKNEADLTSYEVESISFNINHEMYTSVNTETSSTSSQYTSDCIMKVQRATATSGGNYKFLGTTISQ